MWTEERGGQRPGAAASCAQRSGRSGEEASLEEEAFPGGGTVSRVNDGESGQMRTKDSPSDSV